MKTFNLPKNNKVKALTSSGRGFTLVETLVAITILMIAIAGPLAIVSKGMRTALYSKDQMAAAFLAQETMESVKNGRDNAIQDTGDEGDWLNYIGNGANCTSAPSSCDLSPLSAGLQTSGSLPDGLYQIYFNSSTGFSSLNTGIKTIFRRGYYLEPSSNDPTSEKVIHVLVRWEEGTIPFETELVGLLVKQKM